MQELLPIVKNILTSQTFWTAVGVIFAGIASFAIFYAGRQLYLSAWLKAQEIFTSDSFVKARGVVLKYYPDSQNEWSEEEKKYAFLVCRKMDELSRLARFLGLRKVLSSWDDPIGKCWHVLEDLIRKERNTTGWLTKWNAFEKLGEKALSRVKRREQKLTSQKDD